MVKKEIFALLVKDFNNGENHDWNTDSFLMCLVDFVPDPVPALIVEKFIAVVVRAESSFMSWSSHLNEVHAQEVKITLQNESRVEAVAEVVYRDKSEQVRVVLNLVNNDVVARIVDDPYEPSIKP